MASASAKSPAKRPCTQCKKPNAVPPARLCPTCKRANAKASAAKAHARRVEQTYGITAEDYQKLSDASAGRCFICAGNSKKRLAVDHDHKTGEVRGLLCLVCNHYLLGRVGYDDPVRLALIMDSAIRYLKDPPARRILGSRS